MTDTMILAFNDTEVRSITEENEIWFALVDVCKILELSNPRRVAQRLDDDEKRNFKLRLPGRDPWFVNEPGLYHVILTCLCSINISTNTTQIAIRSKKVNLYCFNERR